MDWDCTDLVRLRWERGPRTRHGQETAQLYKALDRSQPSIRLLEIQPSSEPGDVVECQLLTVSLEKKPKYTALSYVWGADEGKKTIILDGTPVSVTQNLEAALSHLRNVVVPNTRSWPWTKPRFWADAICINQLDVLERNHQVQQMGAVYSKASLVIAWLGPENSNGLPDAVKVIKLFSRKLHTSKEGRLRPGLFSSNRKFAKDFFSDLTIFSPSS
jgi:hypothetical protein